METAPQHDLRDIAGSQNLERLPYRDNFEAVARANTVARLRLLWEKRRFLFRSSVYGLIVFTIIAFLIPKRFESTVVLMPPDDQSTSGIMMAAALGNKMS